MAFGEENATLGVNKIDIYLTEHRDITAERPQTASYPVFPQYPVWDKVMSHVRGTLDTSGYWPVAVTTPSALCTSHKNVIEASPSHRNVKYNAPSGCVHATYSSHVRPDTSKWCGDRDCAIAGSSETLCGGQRYSGGQYAAGDKARTGELQRMDGNLHLEGSSGAGLELGLHVGEYEFHEYVF
ncbi:hypothetical protein J6590_101362 [Homalodisca vitripennis]|nr:hypothetical protein J6590_101362 [Homalodisca vitripennis]